MITLTNVESFSNSYNSDSQGKCLHICDSVFHPTLTALLHYLAKSYN